MSQPKDIHREVAKILTAAKPPFLAGIHVKPILISSAIIILSLAIAYGVYAFLTRPLGKITSPKPGMKTGHLIEIEGYTKNIPLERKFIWLAVDVKDLGLCWPKRQIYNPNKPFNTMIYENGPYKNFTVSLYAVDRDFHDAILKWQDVVRVSGAEEGFPMLPDECRLDSISLTL